MSARDDYLILACVATDAQLFCWTEARAALDEIDRLRSELAQARFSEHTQMWADEIRGKESP